MTRLIHYAVGGAAMLLIGTFFMAGWHFSTNGDPNFLGSITGGVVLLVFAACVTLAATLAKIQIRGIENGVALAIATILFAGSFPLGDVFACFWNAIGGAYPDMSGLGNRLSEIVGVLSLSR